MKGSKKPRIKSFPDDKMIEDVNFVTEYQLLEENSIVSGIFLQITVINWL